jgi:hypothetical protein
MAPLLLRAGLAVVLAAGAFGYDPRWRREPYRGGAGYYGDVVPRVLSHLRGARSYRYVDNHDRRHFEDARRHLERFQSNWSRGRFDSGRLDDAIDNLKHLAQADRVHPRERAVFAEDIRALREFRARRGDYYGRGRW